MNKIKPKSFRLRKGLEKAMKLKDLEAARMLEINNIKEKNIPKSDHKQSTPAARSNLPKE